MKTYIGTQIVNAEPVTEWGFCDIKTFDHPTENREGYHVIYEDGSQSWIPKDRFLKLYREISSEEKKLIN